MRRHRWLLNVFAAWYLLLVMGVSINEGQIGWVIVDILLILLNAGAALAGYLGSRRDA